MRVEVTEGKLKDAGYSLVSGDTITVPDEVGKFWCDRGWAKDTSGAYASAERVPGVFQLVPQKGKVGGKSNG